MEPPVLLACVLGAVLLAGVSNAAQPFQPTSQPASLPASAPASRPAPLDDLSLEAMEVFDLCEKETGVEGYSREVDSSPLAWGEADMLMGYLGMYEATRDERFLNTMLARIERILANRGDRLGLVDDVRGGKTMPCWINQVKTGNPRIAWAVHNGMIIYPMIRLVVVLQQDPALSARHAGIMKRILADTEETIQAFESEYHDGPAVDEGWYWCPDLKADLPFNMQNALGRAMLAMYAATGKVEYRDRAARLARFFKYRLRRIGGQNGRYLWDYWTHRAQFEDVSHGGTNVDFVYTCYRAGVVFTRPDLKRFTNTFKFVTQDSGFSDFIDGTGKGKYAIILARWGHLGHLDKQVRQILLDYIVANRTENNIEAMLGAGYIVETQYPDNAFYDALERLNPTTKPAGAASQPGR